MTKNQSIKSTVVRWKVYIDRGRTYLGYASMAALVTLIILQIGMKPKLTYYPIGFLVLLACLGIAGWIDTKFGFFQLEAKRHSDLNPVYTDMLERLERIEERTETLIYDLITEPEIKREQKVTNDLNDHLREGMSFHIGEIDKIDFNKLPLRRGTVRVHTVDPQWTPEFAAAVKNGEISDGPRQINTQNDPCY